MKHINFLSLGFSIALVVALNGCGGSGSSSSDSVTISGKAIDPYLSGSKVFLDLNENSKHDLNEPSTVTDKNGNYNLDIPKEYQDRYQTLVVTDGIDTGTNQPFEGTLTAVKDINTTTQNITPLTSVVEARFRYCKTHQDENCPQNLDGIIGEVAPFLGISEDRIDADIVALANSGEYEPLKTALALEASAEYQDSEHPYNFYETITGGEFSSNSDWTDHIKASNPDTYKIVDDILNTDTSDITTNDFAEQVHKFISKDNDISNIAHFGK